MGIPFWVQKSATEGFNGGDPSGFSAGAGDLSTSTYPNWKNYTFSYAAVSRLDLLAKWRKASEFTKFMPPNKYPEQAAGLGQYRYYTTYRLLAPLEALLEGRNENLGVDLAKYAGDVVFKGVPVKWVPQLENSSAAGYDSTDPIYGINWKVLRPYTKTGRWKVRSKPMTLPQQHTVRAVFTDYWLQQLCIDRRRLFVGYYVAA
jgi:hypothetical protein